MKVYNRPSLDQLTQLLRRPLIDHSDLENIVAPIIKRVATEGDNALCYFTQKFDQVTIENFKVSPSEFAAAEQLIDDELKAAIQTAHDNIRTFHQRQATQLSPEETMPGVSCWQKSVAIQRVGLYVPGGTAPLFSSVLMLGIPAKIAGCEQIVLCTPPSTDGSIHPAILYTAQLVGIDKVYKTGGAQAIAAMTYGTETVPKCYKLFGPGNQYVTAAKQWVNKLGTAIDMPAGPSEVMVVAGSNARPEFVAADLLSQAEHGIDSQVVLVALEQDFVDKTLMEIDRQLETLPRAELAEKALENSLAIIADSENQMLNIVNEYAPEHLILAMDNADAFSEKVINAGSIFLGHYTPESVGDYASGTNHTLPTNGFARAFSGVNLDAFVKKITYQKLSPQGLRNLGPSVEKMALAEQLQAHQKAVEIRLKTLNK